MARRGKIIYNPAVIYWRDALTFVTVATKMTLCGIIRLLIDQATSTGTLPDYPVTGDIFFPAQQIYDAGNEVIDDVWSMMARQATPVQLTTASFTCTQVPVAGTAGPDIFAFDNTIIMVPSYLVLNTTTASGAARQTTDQKYWITDRTKLEQYNNNWKQFVPAQPKWFVLWDAFHIRCFPSADQNYVFTLFGVPWATELTASAEDITCDAILKLAIAYRAAANILETTRPDTADVYRAEAEELLNRYRIRLRNESTNNLRRMKPGVGSRGTDKTIAATKGVIKIGRSMS